MVGTTVQQILHFSLNQHFETKILSMTLNTEFTLKKIHSRELYMYSYNLLIFLRLDEHKLVNRVHVYTNGGSLIAIVAHTIYTALKDRLE